MSDRQTLGCMQGCVISTIALVGLLATLCMGLAWWGSETEARLQREGVTTGH